MVSENGMKALVMMYCVPSKNDFEEFGCADGSILRELECVGLTRYDNRTMFLTSVGKACLEGYLETPAGKKCLRECLGRGS